LGRVRKHGYSKRRTWRKIHVGMCADSGQIVVSAMTSNNVSDDEAMVHMMDALQRTPLGDVLGDGAYDTLDCREAVHDRGGNRSSHRIRMPNYREENRYRHYKRGIRQFGEYRSLAMRVGLYGNKKLDIIVGLRLRRLCFDIKRYWENGLLLASNGPKLQK